MSSLRLSACGFVLAMLALAGPACSGSDASSGGYGAFPGTGASGGAAGAGGSAGLADGAAGKTDGAAGKADGAAGLDGAAGKADADGSAGSAGDAAKPDGAGGASEAGLPCDGAGLTTYYVDKDSDGYGVDNPQTNQQACTKPAGYAVKKGDCDDAMASINPGAPEVTGNTIDENCDGTAEPCIPGVIECNGNTVKQCDPNGIWSIPQDCGTKKCSPLFGCVVCLPADSTCNGNTAHKCLPDGSGFVDVPCDPLVGSNCAQGACTGPCAPENLGKSYIGCDYFPTVTVNTQIAELGGFDYFHYAIAVSNTTSDPASVTVTKGAATVATKTVAPDSVEVILLPWTELRTATSSMLSAAGSYRVRSTRPVTVYQFNPLEYMVNGSGSYTNDASLMIPVTAWGTKYMVASRNTWEWSGFNLPGFYAVVAHQDNTKVTLSPSATGGSVRAGGGVAANGTGTVTLNTGDVLQVLSGTPTSADLTGTVVSADKPVEVLGGHNCTFIPANIGYCDHLEESMFAIPTLASQYIVSPPSLPTLPQPKAFFVRVIAAEAGGTSVTYDPPNAAWPKTLANLGDYFEIDASVSFQIQASRRVLVSQYMKGQDAGGGSGDPAMALGVANLQFRKDYLFHSPVNYEHNYVNITAPTGANVLLDNNPVGAWQPLGTTGYGIARVKFASTGNGNHRIKADQKVGITVYGYGQYTSYWYPGGLNLSDL
jgi:hypothetical protein